MKGTAKCHYLEAKITALAHWHNGTNSFDGGKFERLAKFIQNPQHRTQVIRPLGKKLGTGLFAEVPIVRMQ